MMPDLIINLPIAPVHMWALYLIAIVFFIVTSAMLLFHWSYYGIKENPRVFIRGFHFTMGIAILVLALIFLTLYSVT